LQKVWVFLMLNSTFMNLVSELTLFNPHLLYPDNVMIQSPTWTDRDHKQHIPNPRFGTAHQRVCVSPESTLGSRTSSSGVPNTNQIHQRCFIWIKHQDSIPKFLGYRTSGTFGLGIGAQYTKPKSERTLVRIRVECT